MHLPLPSMNRLSQIKSCCFLFFLYFTEFLSNITKLISQVMTSSIVTSHTDHACIDKEHDMLIYI